MISISNQIISSSASEMKNVFIVIWLLLILHSRPKRGLLWFCPSSIRFPCRLRTFHRRGLLCQLLCVGLFRYHRDWRNRMCLPPSFDSNLPCSSDSFLSEKFFFSCHSVDGWCHGLATGRLSPPRTLCLWPAPIRFVIMWPSNEMCEAIHGSSFSLTALDSLPVFLPVFLSILSPLTASWLLRTPRSACLSFNCPSSRLALAVRPSTRQPFRSR